MKRRHRPVMLISCTGMAAASFAPISTPPDLSQSISISSLGILGITFATMIVLSVAIVSSVAGHHYSARELDLLKLKLEPSETANRAKSEFLCQYES